MMDGNKVMSEILFRVTDKKTDDLKKHANLTHRGYVIEIFDNGAWWGEGGLTHPEWRILRVPIKKEDLTSLLVPEAEKNPEDPNKFLQRREFKLDLGLFPDELQPWLSDDSRKIPILDCNWSFAELMSYRVQIEKLADPDIFE